MNEKKQEMVRPLAFELARELQANEIDAIAGAGSVPQTWNGTNPGGYPWRDWID